MPAPYDALLNPSMAMTAVEGACPAYRKELQEVELKVPVVLPMMAVSLKHIPVYWYGTGNVRLM